MPQPHDFCSAVGAAVWGRKPKLKRALQHRDYTRATAQIQHMCTSEAGKWVRVNATIRRIAALGKIRTHVSSLRLELGPKRHQSMQAKNNDSMSRRRTCPHVHALASQQQRQTRSMSRRRNAPSRKNRMHPQRHYSQFTCIAEQRQQHSGQY